MSARDSISPKTLPEVSDRFTIVRFDPQPNAPETLLPPLPTDLAWVWVGLIAAGVLTALIVSLVRLAKHE